MLRKEPGYGPNLRTLNIEVVRSVTSEWCAFLKQCLLLKECNLLPGLSVAGHIQKNVIRLTLNRKPKVPVSGRAPPTTTPELQTRNGATLTSVIALPVTSRMSRFPRNRPAKVRSTGKPLGNTHLLLAVRPPPVRPLEPETPCLLRLSLLPEDLLQT